MFRCLSFACAMIAVVLIILACRRTEAVPELAGIEDGMLVGPDPSGVTLDDPDQDLGELPVGEHRVVFHATNHSRRPAEIVGGNGWCRETCCLSVGRMGRIPLPPGGTCEAVVELLVTAPGPFEFSSRLVFRDGDQLRTIPFKLSGMGVAEDSSRATDP